MSDAMMLTMPAGTFFRSERQVPGPLRKVRALLTLGNAGTIVIQSRETVSGRDNLEVKFQENADAKEAGKMAGSRKVDVRPPARWGLNE